MPLEENQNLENTKTGENIVSEEPKQEVVENVPIVEETPVVTEVVADEQITSVENIENRQEEIKIPEVIEVATETPVVEKKETGQNDAGLPHPSTTAPEFAKTTEEETQTTPPTQEIEQPQPIQKQEAPTPTQQSKIQTVEKIIYQIPPNFIQNLLNKARAKIQERKRKKLDKILLLFETKSQITNSDIQKLLRVSRATAKRYMDILEKENKATQVGNIGKGVFYIKKQ